MMIGKLSILDRDGSEACVKEFNMAGSNLDRLLEYSIKTYRRRWARVEWVAEMQVWVMYNTNNPEYQLLAVLSTGDTNVIIDRRIT